MKRRLRNILFAVFVLLFMILGGYLVFIAQGFVVNFKELKIEKTGAIFLKFTPRDAVLSVNGEETDFTQSGLLGTSGLIIKNLAPGEYRLKISKDGYYDWEKNLEVRSGLIASESRVSLWPETLPDRAPLTDGASRFWLTGKGIVHKNADNRLIFGGITIRGNDVVLAVAESEILITKEGNDHFLIDLNEPRSAVNLTHLFNSLKQRQLALSGTDPIVDVFFHPFSSNKIAITSETSLYTIDTKKVRIDKLVTLDQIKSATLSLSNAFLLDNDSNLIIVNLLLQTSLAETAKIEPAREFVASSDGMNVFVLTPGGGVEVYRRATGKTETLLSGIREFRVSPEEKRIAAITNDNKLVVVYLETYESDVKNEAGMIVEINDSFRTNISHIGWLADSPNYLLFLEGNDLIVQEIDSRTPQNRYLLQGGVLNYETEGKEIYILKDNGELTSFSTVAGA